MKIPTNNMQLFDDMSFGDSHPSNGSYYSEPDDSNPVLDGDFSEYMWMENEEQFDRQVMAELEEEELIEQCMEAMLEDELISQTSGSSLNFNQTSQGNASSTFHELDHHSSSSNPEEDIHDPSATLDKASYSVDKSTLNPLAAEFVPATRVSSSPA